MRLWQRKRRILSGYVHHGPDDDGAIVFVLVKVNDVVFVPHQFFAAHYPGACAAREIRVRQSIYLVIDMQPHVDCSDRIVTGNPRLDGIEIGIPASQY